MCPCQRNSAPLRPMAAATFPYPESREHVASIGRVSECQSISFEEVFTKDHPFNTDDAILISSSGRGCMWDEATTALSAKGEMNCKSNSSSMCLEPDGIRRNLLTAFREYVAVTLIPTSEDRQNSTLHGVSLPNMDQSAIGAFPHRLA